jgi:pre-mRNA-splicing factor ATP-dependent RNA helicase DHX15/PRP43
MSKNENIGILDPEGKYNNPLTDKPYSETYRNLAKIWSKFPAYQDAKKFIHAIHTHSVTLVVSGTGSGKTVLFPKYVLHALNYIGKIAITLPKRDSAESAGKFAADTMDVHVGEEIGYQFRGSGKSAYNPNMTKLLYCTDGTLVARLLTDPTLAEFDAVIVDEAHERKVNIDFLLYLLKNVLKLRPEFKLVIMSATINEEIFKQYYKGFSYNEISIGTKPNYPIKSIFLETELVIDDKEYMKSGFKLIEKLLRDQPSQPQSESSNPQRGEGILFFVTSRSETNDACDELIEFDESFKDTNICVPMFSGMTEEKRKLAIDKDYYRGFVKNGRKIIVSTNVAESSITIEGIGYVIDSGLELRSRYDPINKINILEKTMITQAQAKQRMGRTGRTGPGVCYHLYTDEMFNTLMDKFPAPSIKNDTINYEIIRLMAIKDNSTVGDIKKMFNEFIEPPDANYVEAELKYLNNLDIISDVKNSGQLTELGKIVSELQIEPIHALTMIAGYRLNCFREVSAIIALIDTIKGSIGDLFVLPVNDDLNSMKSSAGSKNLVQKLEKAKKDFINKSGDHISLLKIFKEYEEVRKNQTLTNDWTYKYFLKRGVLEDAYNLYTKMKYRHRQYLAGLNLEKLGSDVLDTDIKYRILASFMYGSQGNLLVIKNKRLETSDGNIKGIDIDPDSFYNIESSKKDKLFYYQLFKFGKKPVKSKIVSKISKKSEQILNALLQS